VAGVDEVGRGCLVGSVYAGAVLLPETVDYVANPWLAEIRDSKLLDADTRERLAPLIERWAAAWGVAGVPAAEIDRLNIYHASHEAMRRALARLSTPPARVLVDGNRVPSGLGMPARAIVKGDLQCLSIAAASILAKVARDREMVALDARHPQYGFAVHKGYPTPMHLAALRELGPLPEHRMSFGPVKALASAGERLGTGTQGEMSF
jgi:ribonuclease HII